MISKKYKSTPSTSFSSCNDEQVLGRLRIESLTRETKEFLEKRLGEADSVELVAALGLMEMAGSK